MPGPFAIQNANGSRTLDFLEVAPEADTGQPAIPVRVISQLGAGAGGGATGGLTDAQLRALPVDVAIVSGAVGGSSAGLTDAELRASPVPVSGFPTTQPVSGTVNVGNLPAVQPVSGSVAVSNFPGTQPVSGPLTDIQLRANAVPVSGTFWPATQPVSGIVGVNNFPATQPISGTVSIGNFPASQPVTGTFWPATQPVSQQPASLAVSVTGAAAAAVTATLPAVVGQFHYISRINIIAYATVARTGAAAPVVVTSTNLPSSLAWTTPTAAAVGTQYETDIQLTSPLKSSTANLATTIVAPATASVIWRINVIYYTGP